MRREPQRPKALQMKQLEFLGSSRDDLADMPAGVPHDIGVGLMWVQFGTHPTDFKTMSMVGAGAYEIRVRDAFKEKTQRTAKADIDLAKVRYKMIVGNP